MDKLYVHMQPSFVFVGGKDPEDWMVGVQLDKRAGTLLTNKDREVIGQAIAQVVKKREEANSKNMIVLPGTGLVIPGKKGFK